MRKCAGGEALGRRADQWCSLEAAFRVFAIFAFPLLQLLREEIEILLK